MARSEQFNPLLAVANTWTQLQTFNANINIANGGSINFLSGGANNTMILTGSTIQFGIGGATAIRWQIGASNSVDGAQGLLFSPVVSPANMVVGIAPSGANIITAMLLYHGSDTVTNVEALDISLGGLLSSVYTIACTKLGTGVFRAIAFGTYDGTTFNEAYRMTTTPNLQMSADLLMNAKNIQSDATTGTKIGTATTQKLAFFNSAPIVQPSTGGTATGYTAGSTVATFHSDDTYTGNVGTTAYTVNGIVANLKNLGLLAS